MFLRLLILRVGKNNFKILKIVFEYGFLDFNLYKYVVEKIYYFWKMVKYNFILKDEGKFKDGFFLLYIDGENILENCLKIFDFE